MPSNTAVRCVGLTEIGILEIYIIGILWYRIAQSDDCIVVGMLRHRTAAVAVTFSVGPPLVWCLNRVLGK